MFLTGYFEWQRHRVGLMHSGLMSINDVTVTSSNIFHMMNIYAVLYGTFLDLVDPGTRPTTTTMITSGCVGVQNSKKNIKCNEFNNSVKSGN